MVRLGSGAKPGIFPQQQARRAGRVIDAIWNQYPRFTELEVRSHLARFGYRGEEVFKDCASLSGGELARLRFAELALERPNLMFLDEPTNHLDIYMRESLTQALAAYTGTLLLVTASVFAGDQYAVTLQKDARITLNQFAGQEGLQTAKALSTACVNFASDSNNYTIPQAIPKMKARRVFVQLGSNDVDGTVSVDSFLSLIHI